MSILHDVSFESSHESFQDAEITHTEEINGLRLKAHLEVKIICEIGI